MKIATMKIKKKISAKVLATQAEVKIKFPKQIIGNVAIYFSNNEKEILLRQFELVLHGDNLNAVRVD